MELNTENIKERIGVIVEEMIDEWRQEIAKELLETSSGRWKIVRARIRNGKVQRRRKVSTRPGFTFRKIGSSVRFIRIPARERLKRRIGARRAKIKKRAKIATTKLRRKRSMRKRLGLGLRN